MEEIGFGFVGEERELSAGETMTSIVDGGATQTMGGFGSMGGLAVGAGGGDAAGG